MKKDENLKKEITLLGLSANIINTIIGAGIFVLPATVTAGLGSASIFAYLFCAVLIMLIMLCFAEVGSKRRSLVDRSGSSQSIHNLDEVFFNLIV